MKIRYHGWAKYTDWGKPYQQWRFEEDVPSVGALKGDHLDDRGPSHGAKRFVVRRKQPAGELKHVSYPVPAVLAKELFGGAVPGWSPPTTTDIEMLEGMTKIAAAVLELNTVLRSQNAAQAKLDEIRRLMSAPLPNTKPEAPTGNRFVRLKGEYEYNNGDPYKDWELLVDVPEIPVTRVERVIPMHAAKGDVLRERDDDELTPFELRRDGKRIGDPEWWQVRHLFEGIGDKAPQPPEDTPSHPPLPAGLETSSDAWIFRAREDIPDAGVRCGDYLLWHWRKFDVKAGRALVRRIPRAQIRSVGLAYDSLTLIRRCMRNPPDLVRRSLCRRQSPKWSDASSPLVIVRPLVAPVSSPIQAPSDAAALFELITQAGGRMPRREEE